MPESDASLRDQLARDRTRMANERTLLAYGRTAIMLLASGATALKLYGDEPTMRIAGWALIGAASMMLALGVLRFIRYQATIQSIEP